MYAEPAIRTLESMYRFSKWLNIKNEPIKSYYSDRNKVKDILSNVKSQGRSNLLEDEGYEVTSSIRLSSSKKYACK